MMYTTNAIMKDDSQHKLTEVELKRIISNTTMRSGLFRNVRTSYRFAEDGRPFIEEVITMPLGVTISACRIFTPDGDLYGCLVRMKQSCSETKDYVRFDPAGSGNVVAMETVTTDGTWTSRKGTFQYYR